MWTNLRMNIAVFIFFIFVFVTVIHGQISWIRQPSNITAIVGSDVSIPCEFSGLGRVLPYWRINESAGHYSLNLPSGYRFSMSRLIINAIMASFNMSSYSCYIDLFDGSHYESTVGYITLLPIASRDAPCPACTTNYDVEAVSTDVLTDTTATVTAVSSLILHGSQENSFKKAGLNHGISIGIGLAALGIAVVAGIFILSIGITVWSRKYKQEKCLLQGHIYEEPPLPEPLYEQVNMSTFSHHESHDHSQSDNHNIEDPITDTNVAYMSSLSAQQAVSESHDVRAY